MSLSNETIVGIISLLIMCIPFLGFFVRYFRRHRHHSRRGSIPLQVIPGPDELNSLESGMLYARRTMITDTVVIRPAIIPHLRGIFRRHEPEHQPLP
ncbi:hypothetical protein GGR52DRAFT_562784 [Hypoxylon sp. FL1284]|nr:hypothetical protein GGR52DRAFT_562784 [Hypoxylon sp. FL1284]